jgi:hypothetical protein
VSPNDVRAYGADRSVLLTWRPIVSARGYNVYQVAPAGAGYDFTKLNATPVSTASYTDRRAALRNGVRALYAVSPVLERPDGSVIEGPAVRATATPIGVPGFLGCSMGEEGFAGAATLDAATGTIAIQGSGQDVRGTTDQGFLVMKPFSGDLQVTAKVLEMPEAAEREARTGIMIRESIDPNARNVFLYVSPSRGVGFQYRRYTDGATQQSGIPRTAPRLPIYLRLVMRRQGNDADIRVYTSMDGVAYEMRNTMALRPGPTGTLYAGLAITAANSRRLVESRFQQLVIEAAR